MTEPSPAPQPVTVHPPVQDLGQNAGVRLLMPVGRCGYAIAAGYLGLFSVLPLFGVAAVITAIIAHRRIRANPKLHGMGRVIFAYIAGGLGTLLWGAGAVVLIVAKLQGK